MLGSVSVVNNALVCEGGLSPAESVFECAISLAITKQQFEERPSGLLYFTTTLKASSVLTSELSGGLEQG